MMVASTTERVGDWQCVIKYILTSYMHFYSIYIKRQRFW